MLSDFEQPNLEHSPEEHDQEAVASGSTEQDIAALLAAQQKWSTPAGPCLDIGCGTGRHVRALRKAGQETIGVDLDQRMIDACITTDPSHAPSYLQADATALHIDQLFSTISLFNRSLVCFHSHQQASGLFASVAKHLLPGGIFIIDNCCTVLWDQVREGYFADGLSDDGSEQMFFIAGENRFCWRRGASVDPKSWLPKPTDRIFRLWSLGEVALAATGAGLALCDLSADTPYLILQRPEA